MYSIQNLTIHFTGENLFEDVSFLIQPKDRIGLVGPNGAGKTTLLRLINGELEPESGEIIIPAGHKVGYLPQELKFKPSMTVRHEALVAFEEINQMEKEIEELTKEISMRNDYDSEPYNICIQRLADLTDRVQLLGGFNRDEEVEKVLLGLGFKREEFDKPLTSFSGGWQMRVVLAKIILRQPNLLMMDEPTNHLDIESITWLESYLKEYLGAVIIVSHDRAFLDNITHRTIEISNSNVYDFNVNYSEYVKVREQQLEHQQAVWANKQQEIKETERFIERFRYKATKARQVQSRIKMLEKMDLSMPEEIDKSAIHFRFPSAPPSGKVVFEAEELGKCFGNNEVLKNLNFAILKNDAIAFVGRNGEGKTTLSRIIVGELEHQGNARLGHNVKIGYFAQNQAQLLNEKLTVLQTLEEVTTTQEVRSKLRTILGGFLFIGDDVEKKVKVLSGGEKTRLSLARMLLTPVNLLVLDEPTNHLDMRSKDILKNALIHFDGTIIIVSHDRDFLQGLTNKVFEFKNQKIREHLGDVYDFLSVRKIENFKELEAVKKINAGKKESDDSKNKMQYFKKREEEKALRKRKTKIKQLEEEILKLEKEKAEIEKILSQPSDNPGKVTDELLYEKYAKIDEQIDDCYEKLDNI